ncbi:MAG TPA: phosphopantetheine-binding protein [Vicinamibacterales bacterium]|nr:phosphopantetheine-binding protein [Vicinamibacterales bacterium]
MSSPADVIRQFLQSRFRSTLAGRAIGDDDRLFSSGLIDSFGVLELIAFLEDTFGVSIDTARHDLKEFDTIAKIAELLDRVRAA